jgi:hypothetical protein
VVEEQMGGVLKAKQKPKNPESKKLPKITAVQRNQEDAV